MLTSDLDQVKMHRKRELPPARRHAHPGRRRRLKVHNHKDSADLKITVPNGTEHSPYWIHLRDWKPLVIDLKPGAASEPSDVGRLLDTLSDGQWTIQAAGKGKLRFDLEFTLKDATGKIFPLARFPDCSGPVTLAYDAGTRYSRRLRLQDDVLYELVDYLKKHPVKGKPLEQTLVYGASFPPKPADPKYTAADEFLRLMGHGDRPGHAEEAIAAMLRAATSTSLHSDAQAGRILQEASRGESGRDEAGQPATDRLGRPAQANPAAPGSKPKPEPADVDPAAKDWDAVSSISTRRCRQEPAALLLRKSSASASLIRACERTDILQISPTRASAPTHRTTAPCTWGPGHH